jgi:hypothetical protein
MTALSADYLSGPRTPHARLLKRAALSGSIASVVSTTLLAMLSKKKFNHPATTTNATSHWLWGDDAYRVYRPTWRHTAIGYVTHHASAIWWALLAEYWMGRAKKASPSTIIRTAAATTATAAFVDYVLVPRRLTPGFERHLSTGAMIGVFATIAAGLALGAAINSRSRGNE